MYTAILLSPVFCDIVRSLAIPTSADSIDSAGAMVTIHECDYRCLAPSEEEFMFYDLLYSQSGSLTGIELRVLDDRVRDIFRTETEEVAYVTWDVFPRIWLGAERSGDPKPSTVELFGDAFLCRADNRQWAVVIDMDGPVASIADLGVLRTP